MFLRCQIVIYHIYNISLMLYPKSVNVLTIRQLWEIFFLPLWNIGNNWGGNGGGPGEEAENDRWGFNWSRSTRSAVHRRTLFTWNCLKLFLSLMLWSYHTFLRMVHSSHETCPVIANGIRDYKYGECADQVYLQPIWILLFCYK